MTTVAVAPLATWDAEAKPGFHDWPHWREASEWVTDHGLEPVYIYRIEFYLVDTPFAKVFRYATENSNILYDAAANGPARLDPVIVVLPELPPPHLRVFQ